MQEFHEWLDLYIRVRRRFHPTKRTSYVFLNRTLKAALVDEIYPHIDYVQKASFIFVQVR